MTNIADLWMEIDEAVSSGIIQLSDINYDIIFSRSKIKYKKEGIESWILNELSNTWIAAYNKTIQISNEILKFSDGHYQCLFDYNYERVICFFCISQPTKDARDKKRQAGFIPGFTSYYHGKDRGHFLSHCQGGGMDVNFFPQKKEINRGWSAAGKIYRKMERFCSKNHGIICFSRPLYEANNITWDPEQIEYGIIDHAQFRVVVFPNYACNVLVGIFNLNRFQSSDDIHSIEISCFFGYPCTRLVISHILPIPFV